MKNNHIHLRATKSKQRGFSFLTAVLYGAVAVYIGVIGTKSFLAYTEFFTIKSIIKEVGTRYAGDSNKIQQEFSFLAGRESVQAIKSSDLIISAKDVSVEYKKVVPMFANVSLVFDFHASSND